MKLFPRLPNRFAQTIFTEQLANPAEHRQPGTTHSLLIWPATGGERITKVELADLAAKIRAVARAHGFPSPLSAADHSSLDIELAHTLWLTDGLSPAEAGFGEVWSFLALVLVPDIVWWRAAGSTNIERFVATDLTRHTLARLWWRGHLFTHGLDDPDQGWALWRSSEIGEADLDQIQTRRGGYGRSPRAFRALVRAYQPAGLFADEIGVDRRTFWRRMFLRWILRLGAFVELTSIPEQLLTQDLIAVAEQISLAADDGSVPTEGVSAPNGALDALEFDDIPLSSIIVSLVEAIRASGDVVRDDIATTFERHTGVAVPIGRLEILSGIAWQGQAQRYLTHEERDGVIVWRSGTVLPAADRRWGDWSIASFRTHVAALQGEKDPKILCSALFSGRPGQTVRRVVRAALREP